MVSEKICLDIINALYGSVTTATQKFLPGTKEETAQVDKEDNASGEKHLYQTLLLSYQLQEIDSAIKWLELTDYLSKVRPFGIFGVYMFKLTDKACKVAENGAFDESERRLFHSVEPYTVFVACQFNSDDQELFRFIKEDLLEPEGFKVLKGNAEGLEDFRLSILNKIHNSRFFLCLLTKRVRLESGAFASSVWLYQEIGAAVALDKKPLVLVEEGIDAHFAGELQKNYEYIEFSRSNYSRVFQNIPTRLKLDLEKNLIPLPKTPNS